MSGLYFEKNPSIFAREKDSNSRTMSMLGPSGSGKTYFCVNQLNLLVGQKRGGDGQDKDRPVYDKIFLFSNSLDATPIKKLDPRLNIIMVKGMNMKVIDLLKRINEDSKCAFRFLVVMDDIITKIRGGDMNELMCTARNEHISTCILVQDKTMLNPKCRGSLHHLYCIRLESGTWEHYIKQAGKDHIVDAIGPRKDRSELASDFKKWLGLHILHCNNLNLDEPLTLIKREM